MNKVSSTWPLNAIVYQIYPRSFQDSNNDGVGDLNGIITRLDYLQTLGVNTIWISPIFPSPMLDGGYDVSDYCDIDPLFGTLSEFKKLLKECHSRKIKLLMDFIPNHTSTRHKWFLESKLSKNNPKRDFYIWKDPHSKTGNVPNNWLSNFGGSAWELDTQTNQYYMHSFHKEQADLNWRNPKVIEEMLNVLRFWLDLGIDGFRVDAPEWMIKDARFLDEPDNPLYLTGAVIDPYQQLIHTYTVAQKDYLKIVKKFINVLEEYGDKFMVTEVWSPSEKLIEVYNEIERYFFAPFNFFIITHPWKAQIHRRAIDNYDARVTNKYTPTYVLGNHDKSRAASRIGKDQLRVAAILLCTLRGIPFIYYGEEIGMTDTEIPKDKVQDPLEKNIPGLRLGRDPERTPMQWNGQLNAGFSKVKPWLPVNPLYEQINVEIQTGDPDSLYELYKGLIKLRNKSQALLSGKYAGIDTGVDDIFCFTRQNNREKILIILNYSGNSQTIKLPVKTGMLILDSHNKLKKGAKMKLENLQIPPNNGYVISIRN